jgi:DNA-binding beta-propeller fold protein YncE
MKALRWLSLMVALNSGYAEILNSPIEVAFSPDGKQMAVSDRTASKLRWLEAAEGKVTGSVALRGKPAGVIWSDRKVYVAQYDAGSVAEVDPVDGKVTRRLAVGPKPTGLAVASARGLMLATDFGLACVVVVDLKSGKEKTRVSTLPQPWSIAVGPDETLAAIGHLTPAGDATRGSQASAVTLLDLNTLQKAAEISLPPGSSNVRGIAFSPDGKWIYVVHTLGRFTLPTTQLERGWINANAMTILDAANRRHYTTVLLDQLTSGAANPWGIAISREGPCAWITLSGAQELACVNLGRLHAYLEGKTPPAVASADPGKTPTPGSSYVPGGIWAEIAKDPAKRTELQSDLSALYAADLITRYRLPGNGPRGVAVSPDGRQVAVAAYFTGEVLLLAAAAPQSVSQLPMGPQNPPTAARRGERAFHDATLCFQTWLSCATCHPEGRADGLNWDLLNDGSGNPKNTKSLVGSHKTPPSMWLGVRANMDMATEKGFHFIQFNVAGEETVQDVREYLRTLEPEKSPYLVNGKLSPKARKGRKVFENPEVGCANCHQSELFTDLKMYNVGTAGELDRDQTHFDNPTCLETWATPPYLHDGSASTVMDLLTTLNKGDRHGKTSQLSQEDREALVEYLLSL